ncbi:hypothetical protein T265_11884 [Opisthorchis viverrini]|uniref:Serine aminopeptidase S33 domain-containing protein n=2 Tax=Opisthorchis viverrini TaxID=6198 RepID=A0A074YXB4_OPIVI|nr:hypothetical protein T265_11884 [Opisthorchis viverrini]KER19293.1 hypothetical protein T265_11884 [Opisthorchis viverrini]
MSSILGEICHLFCCPPRPSHIVAKLAFLPPPPTYSIISCANDSTCHIEFKPEAGWHLPEDATSKLTVFYTMTRRQSRIACMYIPANSCCSAVPSANLSSNFSSRRGASPSRIYSKFPQAMSASCPTLTDESALTGAAALASTGGDTVNKTPYTVLFSHGNAVDIGQMAGFLQSLAHRFGVNVICYDYSGYGVSTGQRLEENLYADAEAVLRELRERFKVPLEQIVLYGQSIGTAPTVELATKYKVAGVVLHSPFMSGLRVVCPGTTRRFCFDPFTNIDKVSRILSPTLIIHGTDDEIIGIHHGRELFSRLPYPLEPAWVEGAGHNDIELFAEYAVRLDRFFNEDLVGPNVEGGFGDQQLSPPATIVHRPKSRDPPGPTGVHRSLARKERLNRHNPAVRKTDSVSTEDTLDTSDTSESAESIRATATDHTTATSCSPPTVSADTSASMEGTNTASSASVTSNLKPRVWTMRRPSTATTQNSRRKTISSVTSTSVSSTTQTRSSLPGDAYPQPPTTESPGHQNGSDHEAVANSGNDSKD